MADFPIALRRDMREEYLRAMQCCIEALMMVAKNKAHQRAVLIAFMNLAAHGKRTNVIPNLRRVRRRFNTVVHSWLNRATLPRELCFFLHL